MRIDLIGETVLCACLILVVPIAGRAQDLRASKDTQLQELSTLAQPGRQDDIDTAQLASAHRQRAESAQEKTNGLWQSWVVAICEGCEDTPSYRKTIDADSARARSAIRANADRIAAGPTRSGAKLAVSHRMPAGRYTNLSSESIAQIRLGGE